MTKLVGIINLTPDSFSGDGINALEGLARIDAMIAQGASVIDIGSESTRPNAASISAEEEWKRLRPLVEALGSRLATTEFSIDTRHVEVARKAIAAGFKWINDVSGAADPTLIDVIRQTGCKLVLMHSLSVPADPQKTIAADVDPVMEVIEWGQRKLSILEQAGISKAQIIFDPGIGFGKTAEQSLLLLKHIAQLRVLGLPLLVGHSRKSFLSQFTQQLSAKRDGETLAVSYYLAMQQVDYLRVHDVANHASMLRIQAAL